MYLILLNIQACLEFFNQKYDVGVVMLFGLN